MVLGAKKVCDERFLRGWAAKSVPKYPDGRMVYA